MREIKFRVWDVLSEHYSYPDSKFKYHHVLYLDGSYENLHNGVGGKEVIVQQYTGVKDKNGKDVYEGDILKINWLAIPEYTDNVCWMPKTLTWYPAGVLTTGILPNYYFEVAGNIFENPELVLDSN